MMIGNNMLRRLLLLSVLLLPHTTTFAQVGLLRTPIFEDEAVRQNQAAKAAAYARREKEVAETIQRERNQMRQVQVDYDAEREQERTRVGNLPPDDPDTQRQIDLFNCTYPSNAFRSVSADAFERCLRDLTAQRESAKRAAIEEQRRIEDEKLRAEQARIEEERRRLEEEAKRAADEAAKAASEKASLLGMLTSTLGMIALLLAIYQRRQYGWQSQAVAVVFGGLSGFQIYVLLGVLIGPSSGLVSPMFASVAIFSGWILSVHLLLKASARVSKVLARSFLLGAAEWLLMIPVGFVAAGRAVSETVATHSGSAATAVGATIGGGLFAFITGGLAIAMTILCLISYAVTHFLSREMKPEDQDEKRKCPECAEYIKAEARKCRFCGAVLIDTTSSMSS